MKKLTGSLQEKNGNYYAVINLKIDGKRKPKWMPLGLPIKGNKRKAEGILRELLDEHDRQQLEPTSQEGDILLADYISAWLLSRKSAIATATYDSYRNMVEGRFDRWFRPKRITLSGLTPQQVQDFYQGILDDGCC